MSEVILTADLGYGDAGKGSIVDWLARKTQSPLVVRYNGGAQAAHNVITPDGRHHTFAQFGSGTFAGAKTYLSRFMLFSPENFLMEGAALEKQGIINPISYVVVDARAPIITPFHRAGNRIQEIIRNDGRHGSCGLGIGECAKDWETLGERMFFASDLRSRKSASEKLRFLRSRKLLDLVEAYDIKNRAKSNEYLAAEFAVFEDRDAISKTLDTYELLAKNLKIEDEAIVQKTIASNATVIFEAAQGALLDEWYAFFPYATRSNMTFGNAEEILRSVSYTDKSYRLGIVRAYGVRHGPGPFVTEDKTVQRFISEPHNGMNDWQREFRSGWFDAVATRYALKVLGGVDGIALTCIDQLLPILDVSGALIADRYKIDSSMQRAGKRFFEFDQRFQISNIKKIDPPDRAYQFELTKALNACTPAVYKTASTIADLENTIEEVLGVGIVASSLGPTANDKSYRWPFTEFSRKAA